MDEEKLMIDAWFFAMIFGNSAVLDKHLDLCWKINAHLNMHDSASFSGFWDDLLSMAASFVALWYKIVPFTGASAFIFPPKKLLTPGQESCETIFWFSVQYYVCKFGHEAHLRLLWFCLYGFGSRTFTRNEKTDQGGAFNFGPMCCEDVFVSHSFWESWYHQTNLAGIINFQVSFDNLWICEKLP